MTEVREFTYHGDELMLTPDDWPRRVPPTAKLLGGASWSFSPGSSRTDTYKGWISPKAKRAFVWWRNPDFPDNYDVPDKYRPYASGPIDGSERVTFRNALGFGWAQEAAHGEYQLPMPSEMTEGFLRDVDFVILCKQIWLSSDGDDEGADDA